MRAAELRDTFRTVPAEWRRRLPGWTPAAEEAVAARVERTSGEKAIAPDDPFRSLRFVEPDAVQVVVIGQDPYPRPGHADGLAFSAARGKPRSLARIFELVAAAKPGFEVPEVWTLDAWARRGVLLWNPVLTVEVGRIGSHERCGWQALTRDVVTLLSARPDPPAFLLWGGKAQAFYASARAPGAAPPVFTSRHPSYDLKREFMADRNHFEATADRVDWWTFDAVRPGD